jgi:Domain of unknown function (DUF5666)
MLPSRIGALWLCCLSGLTIGCGGIKSSGPGSAGNPVAGQITTVTLMASATASGRVTSYITRFTALNLISQSGKTVSLLPAEQSVEFLHGGGQIEPILSANVPQDIYTSMSATIFYAQFIHLTAGAAYTNIDIDADVGPPATFTFAAPITVSGTAMGIDLDLQEPTSLTLSAANGQDVYTITPNFMVSAIPYAASPAGPGDGAVTELNGRVSALSGTGFMLTLAPDGDILAPASSALQTGLSLPVSIDPATQFHGIASAEQLQAGNLVDCDLSFLPDGSIHARRIEVDDATAADRSIGPTFFASPPNRDLDLIALQKQGDTLSAAQSGINLPYTFQAEPAFHISSALNNLASLPFTPAFDSTSFAVGQRMAADSVGAGFNGTLATAPTSLTLEPQTINGSVTSIQVQGGLTLYTIALDPSDLIPMFGGPAAVVVYADSATVDNQPAAPVVGSLIRAHGLLFNDHGTYRLDSEWIAVGVTP